VGFFLISGAGGQSFGGGGEVSSFFHDDFSTHPEDAAPVSVGATYAALGYVAGNSEPSAVAMLARSSVHSAILADSRIPAEKDRFFSASYQSVEHNGRLLVDVRGADSGSDPREIWISLYEGRPPGENVFSGEKWIRCGNFDTDFGGDRGHDIIFSLDADGGGSNCKTIFFQNSANAFQWNPEPEVGFTWDGSNEFFEFGVRLSSTSSSTDGWGEVWKGETKVDTFSNLRMNADAGDAARGFQLVEIGGWNSASGGTYPMTRTISAVRISLTRLGPWAIT
jgi:hypothetical protein